MWGQWGFSRAFAELVWIRSDLCCAWWKICAHHRWRGNPTGLAAAWVGWLEKAVTSVPCLAPLCFLGVEEKRPRTLQWLPSSSWHCENIIIFLCIWLCTHGLMHSAWHMVPNLRVYGMTHALTWRWRKLWQFIGFNSWECSPTTSRKHTRERVWGVSLPVSKNLMTN